MDLRNQTKNQHFISQAELRLNAINRGAGKSKQKIYRFDVKDRENFVLAPGRKMKIENLLSADKLFSFGGEECNFENLFHRYEKNVADESRELLGSVSKSKPEKQHIQDLLISILKSKLLNVMRNPYSVERVRKILSPLSEVVPEDRKYRDELYEILHVKKEQRDHVCCQVPGDCIRAF